MANCLKGAVLSCDTSSMMGGKNGVLVFVRLMRGKHGEEPLKTEGPGRYYLCHICVVLPRPSPRTRLGMNMPWLV